MRRFRAFVLLSLIGTGLAFADLAAATSFTLSSAPGALAVKQPGAARASRLDLDGAAALRDADRVSIEVFGRSVALDRERLRSHGGGWSWHGRASGDATGWAIFSYYQGRLAGSLQLGATEYDILPLADGGSALIELDSARMRPPGPPIAPPLTSASAAPATAGAGAPDGVLAAVNPIDLLIAFTPEAAAALGGRSGVVALAWRNVDWANHVFENLQMNLRFRLTAVRLLNLAEDDADLLGNFRTHPQANNLRNRYGADLMSLYLSENPDFCGRGYVMRNVSSGFADWAYQWYVISCGVTSYAHEHGHNMGLEHDPDNSSVGETPADASYPWSFGHGLANGADSFRTIMAYAGVCGGGPCPRIAGFSSPDWFFAGEPIGIAGQRDNRRTLNLTSPVVKDFRPSQMIFQHGFDY